MSQSKGTINETEDEFASSEFVSESNEYGEDFEDSENDISREESSVSNIIMSFNRNPRLPINTFHENDSTGSERKLMTILEDNEEKLD